MITKKKLLFAAALMLCLGTMQAQETNLLVHSGAGSPQTIALSSIGKITFSEGAANVLYRNGESEPLVLSSISRLTFAVSGVTGIKNDALDVPALKLYPNPVRDELFVTSDSGIESITVLGLQGNVLLRSHVQSSSARLSLGFLPKGIYLIQVQRTDAVSTQKIIKQ
jgi:hypothetical protein